MRLVDLKESSSDAILTSFGADASRKNIADRFVELGLPNKKVEEYRYADIESVVNSELSLVQNDLSDIALDDKIIITDGMVTHAPDSVVINYTTSIGTQNNHFDAMYHLGHIASRFILSIEIKSEISLEIIHRYTKPDSLLPYRVALFVAPNTHVNIYEKFESQGAGNSVVLYGYDVFLDRDATLTMTKNQTTFEDSYRSFASHRFALEDNSTLNLATFDYGSASSLQTIQVELGQRAHVEASHLLYANKSAKRGTVSKILHIGEGSTSNQRAKNILDDSARGIFDALIKVENSAKYTKAHQNSNAILLKTGAYMASKPQLEIYIDELEASHGSTTGQLDEKQLFYLRSRGIKETEARKMLVQAFANEVIDGVADERIREELHRDFETVYYGEPRVECIETCHGCETLILDNI